MEGEEGTDEGMGLGEDVDLGQEGSGIQEEIEGQEGTGMWEGDECLHGTDGSGSDGYHRKRRGGEGGQEARQSYRQNCSEKIATHCLETTNDDLERSLPRVNDECSQEMMSPERQRKKLFLTDQLYRWTKWTTWG